MITKNDITGDKLATKPSTDAYRDNWDRIFGAKSADKEQENVEDKTIDKLTKKEKPE